MSEQSSDFLIDILRRIDNMNPIVQILLSQQEGTSNNVPQNNSISSLAAMCFTCIVKHNTIRYPKLNEPKNILEETCSYLIQLIHDFYQRQKNKTNVVANSMGMNAIYHALSARFRALPTSKKDNMDGCTKLLLPPDTSRHVLPSTVTQKVEDLMTGFKIMGERVRNGYRIEHGGLKSVDDLRKDHCFFDFLHVAMMIMNDCYTFEQCLDAFSHPVDDDYDIDDWIGDFASKFPNDEEADKTMTMICAFAGIVRALKEYKETGETKEYDEEEPDMYHGWTGSWENNPGKLKLNDVLFGVKFGSILEYAEDHAKKMVTNPLRGTVYSSPRARFHQDMSKEEVQPKVKDENVSPDDIIICRAEYEYPIDMYAFRSQEDDSYSSKDWSHDGTIGFCHVGYGWKNREFLGHIYTFGDTGFQCRELRHEFWETPRCIHADATNSTVWVHADERIKGFSTNGSTNYIFHILSEPRASATSQSVGGSVKRQKMNGKKREGHRHLMVLGDCIGYLENGILQKWKLNEANRHDGLERIIYMEDWQRQIDDMDEEEKAEILNWGENTWMDCCGRAEASIGVKPDSVSIVDIFTPSSIGYLPDSQLSFAHIGNCHIPIYNYELREVSRLVGFGSNDITIVQRPTFEQMGDGTTFVASNSSCVKIFDLRSGKAEMTIRQRCITSTPVYLSDAKFVLNRLPDGQGAMMWDLRAQKPLYSLPISEENDIAWVPVTDGTSTQPILLTDKGECYKYGTHLSRDDDYWGYERALSDWSKVENTRSS